MNREEIREKIAEQCYWDYMGQDERWHPLSLSDASEDMKREMRGRAIRICDLIPTEVLEAWQKWEELKEQGGKLAIILNTPICTRFTGVAKILWQEGER